MALLQVLSTYRSSIQEAQSFILLAYKQDPAGNYVHTQIERDFITASAFLRIFIAWETFLESSFLYYMTGEPSCTGNNITRFVSPIDILHANKLLIGTQKYVDWSNPDIIKRLSKLYFHTGFPYDTYIGSIQEDLTDLKTVRNAAAHLTSTTSQQLDGLSSRKLRRQVRNISVAQFVLSLEPSINPPITILDNYLIKLDIAAEGIANG